MQGLESILIETEAKMLFEMTTQYTPHDIVLETKLRPFIPDYIPAADIPAVMNQAGTLNIPRPDGTLDGDGLFQLGTLVESEHYSRFQNITQEQPRGFSSTTDLH